MGAWKSCDVCDFYPRSPCGERRISEDVSYSIIAFLSTLSLRRATTWARGSRVTYVISIHALLAESDHRFTMRRDFKSLFLSTLSLRRATVASLLAVGRARYFYPRSPCGERRRGGIRRYLGAGFLSTLSLRRATLSNNSRQYLRLKFLSTLSLRRATREPTAFRTPHQRFLSTLSLRLSLIHISEPTRH